MKFFWITALVLLGSQGVTSLSIPSSDTDVIEHGWLDIPSTNPRHVPDLEKRRGGGGGKGGGGGGGGGGSSSSSSSSGGSSGGRSGSSGSSSGRTSSSSNQGGSTRGGSGVSPGYGGGSYYAGGAKTPYSAGGRSPGGISPYLLPLGALAIFPGLWLAGAYAYSYNHPYYYNHNGRNDSLPVTCLCEKYQECGCEDNNNQTYYQDLFNGTEPRNGSNVRVADVNGTKTILINGTLPNGTTASTSAGPGR
ncbi:hypothetical protein POX_b02129 [Penicillium oxalicum]|uniref:hypothetical protein n=1 Tax=Penicillium oxalicum TaxID=69781 RepID=UPI0020B7BE64|nr:hypothetical protein POX_b02129 [Penicillium oxalicum]KAI2792094.1 hypothetical protein POX_b02129 [Penicillium oxalicum]